MSFWKQLFPKQEANPPKSLIGCGVAYLMLVLLCVAVFYLFGAGWHTATKGPTDPPAQEQDMP